MALAAVTASPWTARLARTDQLQRRYTFSREVLDFYGALLAVQELVYENAASVRPPAGELVAYVAELVVPKIAELSMTKGPVKLREGVARRLETADAREMIAAWIHGKEQVMVDRYLARASVGPVLEALGPEASAGCTGARDARHCPTCGGPPQLSYFTVADEDLAAGGRLLLCARCHGSWGYARMTCPGCGENASSRLPIFNEEGTTSGERGSVVRGLQGRLEGSNGATYQALFPHIRIEACEACRHYLLGIDLLAEPSAVPLVDELAAIPLDLVAREQGFAKITPNLMGF